MDIKKSIPWNWFKKEADALPVTVQPRRSAIDSSPLMQLHDELDRVFDDMFRGFGLPASFFDFPALASRHHTALLHPTIDVVSEDKAHTINVEIPGVDKEDVQIEVKDGVLTISGEKKTECDDKDDNNLTHRECSYGFFQRTLSLPDDVVEDDIQAKFKNGVLTLTLPRKELPADTVKSIPIETH